MSIRPALGVVLALSSVARADVRIGDRVYPTREAWYRSPEFRASGARCATPEPTRDPLAFAPADCAKTSTTINAQYDDARVLVIPVVFHVVKSGAGAGELAPALLQSQIDILNEDYEALANTPGKLGTNTRVHFVLAKLDPMGKPTTGIEVVTSDAYFTEDPRSGRPSAMKAALRWDTSRYLNIYTNDIPGGILGYAAFPWDRATSPDQDGVVLTWNAVGRNAVGGAPYDQGRTATHEVGHWLGLYHTFQKAQGELCAEGGPYVSGDLIADTNRHSSPSFGCTPETSCTPPLQVPIENYLNYSDDTCMTRFTAEQTNRIRCAIINYRFVNTAPLAAFTYHAELAAVTFANTTTDAETPAALRYSWTFGDGATSTDPSPTHTYATDGMYTVTLDVLDPGSATARATQAIAVSTTAPPDAAGGTGGTGSGAESAGCCGTGGGGLAGALCAVPVALVLRRRRDSRRR